MTISMVKINEHAQEVIEREYTPFSVRGNNGLVRRDFQAGITSYIERFRYGLGYLDDSFQTGSIAIHDFQEGYLKILPKINREFVYHRRLKESEVQAGIPRFTNSVLTFNLGVPTPQPLAYLVNPKDEGIFFSAYSGAENLLWALRSGLDKQDLKKQKDVAKKTHAYWSLERRLSERYDWLPSKNHFAHAFNLGVEEAIQFYERLDAQIKNSGHEGNPPYWVPTLLFLTGSDDIRVAADNARKDLQRFFQYHREYSEAIDRLCNPEKRSPEDIYVVAENIGKALQTASGAGVILWEVAPRDIIINQNLDVSFPDMERVGFVGEPLNRQVRKKQFAVFLDETKKAVNQRKSQRLGYDLKKFLETVRRTYLRN